MKGKFYLLTLGCQMNKHDSERIAGSLLSLGFSEVDTPDLADVLLINTCSVRQASEDRVYGFIHNWQELRKKNPNLIIGVTGCMPGRDNDGKIRKRLKGVDLFFGIDELPMLGKWLGGLNADLHTDYLAIEPTRQVHYKVSVTVQTGCNNFCSYCVVPYARGREKNRPLKSILAEIVKAANQGCQEVDLLGQVINNYHAPDQENFSVGNIFAGKDDFAALLWEVNQIEGIERVHWTSADPQYFSAFQIEALRLPKQANYIHIAAQSGDNEVLKKMNRHYTREQYIELVKKIREARPDIAIGTDLIVGFCGETEEQFGHTVDLYEQCDFDIAYLAMYSERSGTAAAKAFKDDIDRAEKKRRWQILQDLMEKKVLQKNQKYFGQTVLVLVDSCVEGVCSGNSSEMKLVQFAGTPELVGRVVQVRITCPEMWVLRGIQV